MGEKRLNSLAVLCTESEVAASIDYEEIIDEFAKEKSWKGDVNLIVLILRILLLNSVFDSLHRPTHSIFLL